MNIDNKLKFAQKFFSFKFQTLLYLHFFLEHFKIVFNKRFDHI